MTIAEPGPLRFLTLPGWLNSGPEHWQSRWETRHGDSRVEQDDWLWPKRGDWMARLEEVLAESQTPAVLIAHSLGCHLISAWAGHTRQSNRVRAAMLVAPPDIERSDMPANVQLWRPIGLQRLPFATTTVISSDDPYCSPDRGAEFARNWGSELVDIGPRGHINDESGLDDWPEGRTLLQSLLIDR